jgi:hypothetical protein
MKEKKIEINRSAVKSGSIKSVGYDNDSKTLDVEFGSGQIYRYHDVPTETHQALMTADSVGKYFMQAIRPKHTAHKRG